MNVMKCRLWASKLVLPVIKELPIILMFFLFIKANLIQFFQNNDLDSFWDYFSVFSIYFLYAYFIAATICIFRQAWIRWLWYALLFSVYAVSCFIAVHFEMQICPTLITLLLETNGREAGEFLNTYLLTPVSIKVYIKLAIYIIISVLIELGYRRYIFNRNVQSGNVWTAMLIVPFLLAGIIRWSQYSDYFNFNKPDDEDTLEFPADDIYTRLFCSLCIKSKQSGVFKRAVETSLKAGDAVTTCEDNHSLNVILVIGESFNKHHASLYGYTLETTPSLQLQKDKGNLYDFTDVITPYNYTSMAVKNLMSCNSITDSEKWFDCPYFPVLFKKAGYDVYFWSNQHEMTDSSVYEYALNSYLFNPLLSDYIYKKINQKSFAYDGQLVDDFQKNSISDSTNNLILFHLMGQHTVFASRFPHTREHIRFTINDIHRNDDYIDKSKLQLIADYDNAVLYNDFVLSQIIRLFADRNAVLVFLSDHGEEAFDYRDRMGRSYTDVIDRQYLKYQYEIPFVIWCSDRFKAKYPDMVVDIQNASSRPFMIDNVCQLLFHLGGINTEYYHQERDVLSYGFIPKDRIVRGGVCYDKIAK